MTAAQITILAILVATVAMFLWGRWRHDMVAIGALLACVVTGLVPGGLAFAGFGHPAVVTVACVLVLGHGLQISGAVDVLAKFLPPRSRSAGSTLSILALVGLAVALVGDEHHASDATDASDARDDGIVRPQQIDTSPADRPQTADEKKARTDEVVVRELVVTPNAELLYRSVAGIDLCNQYGISLLAISRQGRRSMKRLRFTPIEADDVLLMQGVPEALSGFASQFGCLPLAARDIRMPKAGHALRAGVLMALTVAVTALGLLPASVAVAAGALAFVATGLVPVRSIYTAVDWPVVVLLANTLILGPGGFHFGDYWRMGLPTDILVVAVGLPMILWVWPL